MPNNFGVCASDVMSRNVKTASGVFATLSRITNPLASQLFQIQTTVTQIMYSGYIAQYHASEYLGYSRTMVFTPVTLLNRSTMVHVQKIKHTFTDTCLR